MLHSVSYLPAWPERPLQVVGNKHTTSFDICPLGGTKRASIFDDWNDDLSLRGTIGYAEEAGPLFPVLQNFSTL